MSNAINILLVEDNPGDARLFKEVISEVTETCFAVHNATCIQDVITSSNELNSSTTLDIIILDLSLPDSTGLNTLQRCKDAFRDVPIIVFSGLDDESNAIEAVKAGAQDYLVKGSVDRRAMVRTIYHAIERHAMWSKLEKAEKRERDLATRDPLTGLPNRHSFNETLSKQIHQCQRQKTHLAIIFLDLDGFKSVNDSLGHLVGDQLLSEVANRLQDCVRKTDTVARLGGDEFILSLMNIQRPEDAARICEKILAQFVKPSTFQDLELFVGCSMGVAVYPQDGNNYETLIKNADAAMYSAKDAGRHCFKFYTNELTEKAHQRLAIENEMGRAMKSGTFKLLYQPIYNSATHSIVGVEALIRWPREDGTVTRPNAFIRIAEETGLIVPMGEMILKEACEQAVRWSDAGLPPLFMSVNVSARQFEHKDFVSTVCNILQMTSLDANRLVLELTENVVMSDVKLAILTLNKLKAMNIHLAIDDFGTGYSSLSYLSQFPLDTLKIDQTFIQNLEHSEKDLALVEAITALAQRLGLKIIAEGIETDHQYQIMKNLGCDQIQGFYLAQPMEADEIVHLLENERCSIPI